MDSDYNVFSNSNSVLSDREIINEKNKGNIVIIPYNQKNVGNCSYDVTLGPWYYKGNKNMKMFLPWDESNVEEYWGTPLYAKTIIDENNEYKLPIGSKIILIEPGELILGSTLEFIGGKNNITTMMKARSTMGRIGISLCKDAGWGDVGYVNRWTLEISNFSNATIPLVVGSRIAQIIFFRTGDVMTPYDKNGNYQKEYDNLTDMILSWHETNMLPKYKL
jgi:dCTP deaminase